jgi:hypothetical protein
MSLQRELRDRVSHTVRGYHRGILGPSPMWLSIADALTAATATVVLDSLPQDVKDQLRAVWLERPPHAYIQQPGSAQGGDDFQAVCVAIVRWCEASSPLDRPTQPDGLIRVCVEDGVVKEWRP